MWSFLSDNNVTLFDKKTFRGVKPAPLKVQVLSVDAKLKYTKNDMDCIGPIILIFSVTKGIYFNLILQPKLLIKT